MITGALQPMMAWAEDKGLLRSNLSADPGAKIERWAAFLPKEAAHLPLRDWHQSDKPSRQDVATCRRDAAIQFANASRSKFQFTVNQDNLMRRLPLTYTTETVTRQSPSWLTALLSDTSGIYADLSLRNVPILRNFGRVHRSITTCLGLSK